MGNIFDSCKLYPIGWNVTDEREFSDKEKSVITECKVVPSNFGRSVMFLLPSIGKKFFIPLEPIAQCNLGDNLDINKLHLLKLEYSGTDTSIKVTTTKRIRIVDTPAKAAESTFENPFGL